MQETTYLFFSYFLNWLGPCIELKIKTFLCELLASYGVIIRKATTMKDLIGNQILCLYSTTYYKHENS